MVERLFTKQRVWRQGLCLAVIVVCFVAAPLIKVGSVEEYFKGILIGLLLVVFPSLFRIYRTTRNLGQTSHVLLDVYRDFRMVWFVPILGILLHLVFARWRRQLLNLAFARRVEELLHAASARAGQGDGMSLAEHLHAALDLSRDSEFATVAANKASDLCSTFGGVLETRLVEARRQWLQRAIVAFVFEEVRHSGELPDHPFLILPYGMTKEDAIAYADEFDHLVVDEAAFEAVRLRSEIEFSHGMQELFIAQPHLAAVQFCEKYGVTKIKDTFWGEVARLS
jgi:hypothetical protein